MKVTVLILVSCLVFSGSIAQHLLDKNSIRLIFKETLGKVRNAVDNASNDWRYDNSKSDYFTNDTIVLNTARSYRMEYCEGVNWSFYKEQKFILEFTHYCHEPPLKDKSHKKDYMRMRIKESNDKIYLKLINQGGLFDSFEILAVKKNDPIDDYEVKFDYSIVLLRHK